MSQACARHFPVIVIGAGLTGMSAALELERLGVAHCVIEKLPVAGGHAITVVEGGWRFDRTGHLLHLRDAERKSRILSYLDEEPLLIQRQSRIFSQGTYTKYPYQANTYGLPPQVAYECLMGFIRAQSRFEVCAPRNFEEFCRQHFGDGISEHFMLPYNARLWGVPAHEITTQWCERFVPLPNLEDVAAGAVGLERPALGYNAQFLYPRLGIGEFSKSLQRRVRHLELGQHVLHVDMRHRQIDFKDKSVTYDVLINTSPLPILLDLLGTLPEKVEKARRALRCSHLWYLDVGLKRPPGIDAHWVYVPEQKYPFYRVGAYSQFSSALVPDGCGSLYVELVSRQQPDMAQLMPMVCGALREMRIIATDSDIEFVRTRKIDFAYVIYDKAYASALADIQPYLQEALILSTGRYGGWNYSAMEDALRFGEEAARSAWELLT